MVFFLYGYRNRKPNLRGFYHSDVRWNKQTWIIENLKDKNIHGEMIDFISGIQTQALGIGFFERHRFGTLQRLKEMKN